MQRVKNMLSRMQNLSESRLAGGVTLLVSIGIFLALTLTRLTASSIWFDEAFSAYIIRFDWADLTHYTAIDVHPPLYYYLLKLWSLLFGSSLASLRAMSVFLGVVAIVLLYFLVKKVFKRPAAMLSVLMLSISPMFVRYGVEMRMYMLVCVIAIAATMVFAKLLQTNKRRWYLIYGVLISLGMWTHYVIAVVWLAHWVYRFIYLRMSGLRGGKLLKAYLSLDWILAHVLAVGLYLPWIPVALKQMSGLSNGFWIPPVTANTPSEYVTDFLLYREATLADGWWAVLVFLTVVLALVTISRTYLSISSQNQKKMVGVIVLAIMPVAFLMLLSLYPLKSMFVDRYLMPAIIALVVLLAVAVVYSRQARLSGMLLLSVLACFILGVANVYRLGNYNRNSSDASRITMADQIVDAAIAEMPNIPIVDTGTYSYYAVAASETANQPVYFDWSLVKDDLTGSLAMMRDNKLDRGISDWDEFSSQHDYVWCTGSNHDDNVTTPQGVENWTEVKTIGIEDPLSREEIYKATLYKIDK